MNVRTIEVADKLHKKGAMLRPHILMRHPADGPRSGFWLRRPRVNCAPKILWTRRQWRRWSSWRLRKRTKSRSRTNQSSPRRRLNDALVDLFCGLPDDLAHLLVIHASARRLATYKLPHQHIQSENIGSACGLSAYTGWTRGHRSTLAGLEASTLQQPTLLIWGPGAASLWKGYELT